MYLKVFVLNVRCCLFLTGRFRCLRLLSVQVKQPVCLSGGWRTDTSPPLCVCVCVRTVRFDGRWRRRWWRRRGWGCGAGVGHLQVPGLLLTGIFTKHPLSDGDLTGPPVSTAGDRQGAVSTAGNTTWATAPVTGGPAARLKEAEISLNKSLSASETLLDPSGNFF